MAGGRSRSDMAQSCLFQVAGARHQGVDYEVLVMMADGS